MANVTEEMNFFELAKKQGLDPWAVWTDPALKALKEKRKHPCFLQVSDTFDWPKLVERPERTTETNNKYQTFLRPTPKVIDVYLGFMDEEVNARLKEVLERELKKTGRKEKPRPVILIERGKVGPQDFILEWPIDNYPKEAQTLKVSQVSTDGKITRLKGDGSQTFTLTEDDVSTAPDDVLARALAVTMEQDVGSEVQLVFKGTPYKRYIDLLWLLQMRRGAKSKVTLPGKKKDESIFLSVIRFSGGDDRQAPIIVIRTPEMGLQPTLMAPYIAFLFKVISMLADQLADVQVERWHKIANPLHERKPDTMKRTFTWPIRVCQFGAQGSTSEDKAYKPGEVLPVVASLFVGPEIATDIDVKGKDSTATFKAADDRQNEYDLRWERVGDPVGMPPSNAYENWETAQGKIKVYAVVSLCTPAGVYDLLRRELTEEEKAEDGCPKNSPVDAAEWLAKKEFYKFGNTPPALDPVPKHGLEEGNPLTSQEKAMAAGKDLKAFIKALTDDSEKLYGRKGCATLTTAYFGGDPDKEAANQLGLVSVGMEDYHVLRVLRTALATGLSEDSDFPLVMGWRIDRINCDPMKIPENVIARFNESIKAQALTKADYRDIILWGLQGVLGPIAPQCAKWGFPGIVESEKLLSVPHQVSDLIYRYQSPQGVAFTPDPLCVEIATDFAKEIGSEGKDRAGKVVQPDMKEVKDRAKSVMDHWKGSRKIDDPLRAKINDLLDAVASDYGFALSAGFKVTAGGEGTLEFTGIAENAKTVQVQLPAERVNVEGMTLGQCKVKRSGSGDAPNDVRGSETKVGVITIKVEAPDTMKMKTWLRPGKWSKDITVLTVQDLEADRGFDGAAVDRAFYKSCNLMALQTLAGTNLLP